MEIGQLGKKTNENSKRAINQPVSLITPMILLSARFHGARFKIRSKFS